MLSKSSVLISVAVFLTIINVLFCYRSNKVLVSADTEYAKLLAILEKDTQELILLGEQYEQDKAVLLDTRLDALVRQSKDDASSLEQLQKENSLMVEQLTRSQLLISFYKKRFEDLLVKINTYSS